MCKSYNLLKAFYYSPNKQTRKMTTDIYDDDHSRTIIHIDLDCFYAQVEMLKNPKLRQVPMGVQQKNFVVTCNYPARDYGVKKCMLVSEALKLCPNLTLVKGEDLHDYRQMSAKVSAIVQKFSPPEKLGLDENFVDVSELVKSRLKNPGEDPGPVGRVFGAPGGNCECGCVRNLDLGSVIASEIRRGLKEELGLSSCAGVSYNKLLAKLGGGVNKPDQQTVVYPGNAAQLLFTLPDVRSIPGIGNSTCETLRLLGVKTVKELRECSLERLQNTFGTEKARLFMDLSFGKDNSPVKPSGRPQSIGIEDSCRLNGVENEVKDKFRQLLHRLMILVAEDGRIPRTLKITVRKFDPHRKNSHREQKQCNIPPSLFTTMNSTIQLSLNSEEKLVSAFIMHLFHKIIDISQPFNVTLLGLAFTKFQDRIQGKNSIAQFLLKNLSVQSVTSFQSAVNFPPEKNCLSNKEQKHFVGKSLIDLKNPQNSPTVVDFSTDGSESEVEPSPKKKKLSGPIIAKRHRFFDPALDCPSPSKLRVAELRLSSREGDRSPPDFTLEECPSDVDQGVFKELPVDVQKELISQWQVEKKVAQPPLKKYKNNSLLTFLIKNK